MRTGRVVASLVSGHPSFFRSLRVRDGRDYVYSACPGFLQRFKVGRNGGLEKSIGIYPFSNRLLDDLRRNERWISIFIHRAAAIKTLSFPFTLGKGSPLCIRVYNDDVILQIMHNISSYIGGKEEEESVTAYFQPSIIPPGHSAYIFPSLTFQFPSPANFHSRR